MFTSIADVFRTRQVIFDLLEIVRLHRSSVPRIGASRGDAAAIEAIVQEGGVISEDTSRSYSSILLAAAMPDEDFNGFVLATAVLLIDRIQGGIGEDDLYWNYDAFREHYLLADAPVRAGLMNAFRLAHERGAVSLSEAPQPQTCYTRAAEDVLLILEAEGQNDFVEAIRRDPSPEDAGALWTAKAGSALTLAENYGFRLLYERPQSLDPSDAEQSPLIPWT